VVKRETGRKVVLQYAKIIKDRIWSFDSTKQSSYLSFECV